jgi:hypothetical protein
VCRGKYKRFKHFALKTNIMDNMKIPVKPPTHPFNTEFKNDYGYISTVPLIVDEVS